MGAKIITEKDFWMCSCGAMPAQLQGVRKSNKKQSGEVYITVEDTSTSSWIDFGCTKSMFLYAMIAAAVVVAAVVITALIVGTGGIAAIGLMGMMAIGAGAGLLGGIVGAIEGGMLCGQKVAKHRHWSGSKSNLLFTGKPAITGANTMTCDVGGVVQFAPNIKSWMQAVALGGMNYLTKFAACAVGGAAVGAGGEMVLGMAGAFAGGASLALPTLGSIGSNIATTFTGAFGGMRVISGAISAEDSLNQYAVGKKVTTGDVASAFYEGSVPEIGMVERIATGNAQPSDALILLYFLNIKAGAGKPPVAEEPVNNQSQEEQTSTSKEKPQPQENNPNEEGPTFASEAKKPPVEEAGGKKGEAYEDGTTDETTTKETNSEDQKSKENVETQNNKLESGSPEHKAQRWKDYQSRGGKWSYDRWSKQYDTNMKNAKGGLAREKAYRDQLGGKSETVKTPYTNRQIDIHKPDEMYAGQLKTGRMTLNKQAKIDIQKDAAMVKQGYQVEYILEKGASEPFLNALKQNGIDYHIGPKIP